MKEVDFIATIRKRGNSYQIRVSVGYDTAGNHKEQAMTWKPDPGMTERQIEKELQRQAVLFEEKCSKGFMSTATKFQDLAEEWFDGYARHGLHSFRHFMASSLISSGIDVVTVSGALGHCNSSTTLNVYSHQFQNSQARVAEAMDGILNFLPKNKKQE